MLYQGVSLILAPLLVFQGIKVRRTTPKLPEPDGERVGQTGANPELSVLIVGDSAAAGVGAANQNEALLGQVVSNLRSHGDINFGLFAKSGATTASTLESLKQQINTTHPVLGQTHFDVIITSLGVNDITSSISCHKWLAQQTALLSLLAKRYRPKMILVTAIPPLGFFPVLPNPLRWSLGQRASQFNRQLQQMLLTLDKQQLKPESETDTRFAVINLPLDNPQPDSTMLEFMGQVMASDGFHPGPQIYSAWAKLIAEEIQPIQIS